MLIVDHGIEVFLANGRISAPEKDTSNQTAIYYGDSECVTNIGYDLRAENFARGSKMEETCELLPGESVFVASSEVIHFDSNTVGKIYLKNSRIRLGLTLDAPIYQPGHITAIYFRITNVSSDSITLSKGEKYAMLVFEQLSESPDHPYSGTFQKEFKFSGLGDYKSTYADQIKSLSGKIDDIKSVEKSIYGNVVTILTIFIAIFSILNINIELARTAASTVSFLAYNLTTIGSISFLAILMHELLSKSTDRNHKLWFIPIVCLGLLLLLLWWCTSKQITL